MEEFGFWAMVILGGFLVLVLLDLLGGMISDKEK